MNITRYGITDGTNGRPIISGVIVYGDTVYISGVTADPAGDTPRRYCGAKASAPHLPRGDHGDCR